MAAQQDLGVLVGVGDVPSVAVEAYVHLAVALGDNLRLALPYCLVKRRQRSSEIADPVRVGVTVPRRELDRRL